MASSVQDLADALNEVSLPNDQNHVMMVAGWDQAVKGKSPVDGLFIPGVWEVSRGIEVGEYKPRNYLQDNELGLLNSLAAGGSETHIRVFSAGLPDGHGKWITNADTGLKVLSDFVGQPLVQADSAGLERFVRFAIGLACDLYEAAALMRVVGRPITTAVMFPGNGRPTVVKQTR